MMKKELEYYLSLPYQIEVKVIPDEEGGGFMQDFLNSVYWGLSVMVKVVPFIIRKQQEYRGICSSRYWLIIRCITSGFI
jgi:hypothetical protein